MPVRMNRCPAAVLVSALICITRPALADAPDTGAPAARDSAKPEASTDAASTDTAVPLSKKRAVLLAKERAHSASAAEDSAARDAGKQRWQRELDRRVGARPERLINLYNTWTHEYLVVEARTPREGEVVLPAERVNQFLRCHFTNRPTNMDPRLIGTLVAAAMHFNAARIDIVSGFRSPKYNLILRKKGREVSRNSQHPQGTAVDFRLPGVAVARLHAWAKNLRMGGVGLYPHSGFIHVDTARVRYWTGR